jgi:hypothetical protein
MAATPILCQGTTMTFNSVAVNGVISITGIGSGSATEIDVTTLASTAKEFKQGLRDFGSIEVELVRNHDDLGQVEMFNAMASQTERTVVITLPSSTANVATFTGFVTSLSTDIGADDKVTGKATIRITGAVAWS